jgi:hypothetical protein
MLYFNIFCPALKLTRMRNFGVPSILRAICNIPFPGGHCFCNAAGYFTPSEALLLLHDKALSCNTVSGYCIKQNKPCSAFLINAARLLGITQQALSQQIRSRDGEGIEHRTFDTEH